MSRAALTIVVACAYAVALACSDPYSDVGGAPLPDRDATSSDDGATSDSRGPDEDAAVDANDASAALLPYAGCIARAPTCEIATCVRIPIYAPPSGVVEYPFRVMTDATYAYWLAQPSGSAGYNGADDARLMRAKKDGSSTAGEVLVTGQARAKALAVTGGYVYWAARTSGDASASAYNELRRAPATCTPPCSYETIATLIVDDVSQILPITSTSLLTVHEGGEVARIDLQTRARVPLGSVGPYASAAASRAVIVVGGGTSADVHEILRQPNATYASTLTLPPTDGGNVGPSALAASCDTVFAVRSEGRGFTAALDASTFTAGKTVPQISYFGAMADERYFYLAAANAGGVYAYEAATGAFVQVVAGNVFDVSTDDDGVYWGDHDAPTGGKIWRLRKD